MDSSEPRVAVRCGNPSSASTGSGSLQIHSRGLQVLDDRQANRGTTFTQPERDHLGLHGLLPPLEDMGDQVARATRRQLA